MILKPELFGKKVCLCPDFHYFLTVSRLSFLPRTHFNPHPCSARYYYIELDRRGASSFSIKYEHVSLSPYRTNIIMAHTSTHMGRIEKLFSRFTVSDPGDRWPAGRIAVANQALINWLAGNLHTQKYQNGCSLAHRIAILAITVLYIEYISDGRRTAKQRLFTLEKHSSCPCFLI